MSFETRVIGMLAGHAGPGSLKNSCVLFPKGPGLRSESSGCEAVVHDPGADGLSELVHGTADTAEFIKCLEEKVGQCSAPRPILELDVVRPFCGVA
jgi:hypothetical protein